MSLDLTQFHESFFEESHEAIASMEDALLRLEVGSPDPEVVNTVFRVAHSIKGGAATFGFNEVASFTHTLETLLDELRGHRMQVTQAILDLLLKSVDVMREMLRATQAKQPPDAQKVADLQFDLELAVAQKPAMPAPAARDVRDLPAATATQVGGGTGWRIRFVPRPQLLIRGNDPLRIINELRTLGEVAVETDSSAVPTLQELDPEVCHLKFDIRLLGAVPQSAVMEIFDWAEGDCELDVQPLGADPDTQAAASVAARPETQQSSAAAPVEGAVTLPRPGAGNSGAQNGAAAKGGAPANPDATSIRVGIDKIDDLMNGVGELVITHSMLTQLGSVAAGADGERLRRGLAQMERNVRQLQESVMRVRMVPVSFVFSRFPRMVRDLAQRLGKQLELRMTGGETEIDKTVLEKIGDPLVHLVRNAIDHGVEQPEKRLAAGKPASGTLHLHVWHRGGSVVIEVGDDGAGLNRERILAKARSRGLVAEDAALSTSQIDDLIFLAGFSTNDEATDVSGRGVGMDVVRRNIEELGGSVQIHSEPGRGARFVISLPLTLAIVDGQTIVVGRENYIVPLTSIVESLQLKGDMIQQVVGSGEVVAFRGECLPVIRLGQMFADPSPRERVETLLMIVEGEGRRAALCVDELQGQQQVVVKALESNYSRVEGVAGATILGDGSVALILDVAGLARRRNESLAA